MSQRTPQDHKLHPCAFFPRRLSPAERNYDVGNRELLVVVLALAEWRRWLEGAEQSFIVWMDHKNLAYLRSTKWQNSRQACWALFLGRFNYTLTYRSGTYKTIFPPSCVVGAATWEVETLEAKYPDPDPGT